MANDHTRGIPIPAYDGNTDPEEFVKEFMMTTRMQGWEDEKKLDALPDYLKGFAKYIFSKIEYEKKNSIDKALKELAEVCALNNNLPEQLNKFFEIDKKLDEVKNYYEKGKRLITLIGDDGMGKFSLALEYAKRNVYQFNYILLINSESISNVIIQFYFMFFEHNIKLELDDIKYEYVMKNLENGKFSEKNILYIFENFSNDEKLIEIINKILCIQLNSKILITTKAKFELYLSNNDCIEFIYFEPLNNKQLVIDFIKNFQPKSEIDNDNIEKSWKELTRPLYAKKWLSNKLLTKKISINSSENNDLYSNLQKHKPLEFEFLKYCSLFNSRYIPSEILEKLYYDNVYVKKPFKEIINFLLDILLVNSTTKDNKRILSIDKNIQNDLLKFIEFKPNTNGNDLKFLNKILQFYDKFDFNYLKNEIILNKMIEVTNKKWNVSQKRIIFENYSQALRLIKMLNFEILEPNFGKKRIFIVNIKPLQQKFIDNNEIMNLDNILIKKYVENYRVRQPTTCNMAFFEN